MKCEEKVRLLPIIYRKKHLKIDYTPKNLINKYLFCFLYLFIVFLPFLNLICCFAIVLVLVFFTKETNYHGITVIPKYISPRKNIHLFIKSRRN